MNRQRDRNYERALAQVSERVDEAAELLAKAKARMGDYRPDDAREALSDAKMAIDGALTSAQWATTLPTPEDG